MVGRCGNLRSAVFVLVRETEPGLAHEPSPAELALLVGQSEPLRDLLTFALSEAYLTTRAKLVNPASSQSPLAPSPIDAGIRHA